MSARPYTPLPGEIPPGDPRLKPLPTRYYSAEEAYKIVSRMPLIAVNEVAAGRYPEYFDGKENVVAADWPTDLGTPPMQFVRAANEFLSAMDKGTPKEINDRMDGAVAQKVDVGVTKFVIETPAKLDTDAWTKLFGPPEVTATIEPEVAK